jgi:hypothetical protein
MQWLRPRLRLYWWSFVAAVCLVLMLLHIRFMLVYRTYMHAWSNAQEIEHEFWQQRFTAIQRETEDLLMKAEVLLKEKT